MQLLLLLVSLGGAVVSRIGRASAEIDLVHPPANVTVALGQTSPAVFWCYYAADNLVWWKVNGTPAISQSHYYSRLRNERGIDIRYNHDSSFTNLTLSVPVETLLNNNTNVSCGNSENTTTTALLTIAGAPLAPSPTFTIVNTTFVAVSWEKPFTWRQYDVHNYTVRIRNSTSGEVIVDNISADDNLPYSQPAQGTITYMLDNNGSVPQSCHTLEFNVSASNAIGESREGSVTGGFPIAPGPFELNDVQHEVTFDLQLIPKMDTYFSFPLVCPFQTANYTLRVINQEGLLVYTTTPLLYSQEEGRRVRVQIEQGLESNRWYTAVIVVETLVGERNITFDFSTMYEQAESTDDTTTLASKPASLSLETTEAGNRRIAVIGGAIGGTVCVLLLGILLLLLCIVIVRQKTVRRKRALIQTAELAAARACENMLPNPIYSGSCPIYDQIADVQMLKSLPREPHERRGDTEAGQYVELSASSSKESNKLAEEYNLHCQQRTAASSFQEDAYTLMNPIGTVRSCATDSSQLGPMDGPQSSTFGMCELGAGSQRQEDRYITVNSQ